MLFNAEEYLKLEAAIKKKAADGDVDAVDDLVFFKKYVLTCCEYVYKVAEERVETRLAKGYLKGDELRQVVERFDQTRHNAHEQAIVSTKALNRIALMYNVGKIYSGNENVRAEIGSFCNELSDWLFGGRYD